MKKIYILLAFVLCAVTAFAQIPTNGLVAYYPFNGNANDASGNANHGVVNGATLTTDRFGNASRAYSFNGTSNYIEVPDNSVLNPSIITLSTWIKTSQSSASFIGKSNQVNAAAEQYSLAIDPVGGFHISIKQNSCTAGSWSSAG